MNRFVPDTLLEALARPLAMAAPNGWVYIEVIAPDFRPLFLVLLLFLSGVLAWKARRLLPVIGGLLAFTAVACVPWLMTTGNGRYFIPLLMLCGILCVALVHRLPWTRGLRVSLVLIMVAVQGIAVQQNHPWGPWNAWGLAEWRAPPFYPLELDAEAKEQPATYVTLSAITYSLVAPMFPPESRWINVAWLPGSDPDSPDARRATRVLETADRLRIFMPSMPDQSTPQGRPSPYAEERIGKFLRVHHLAFARGADGCRLLPLRADEAPLRGPVEPRPAHSPGLNTAPVGTTANPYPRSGFWVCEARFEPGPEPDGAVAVDSRQLQALEVLERTCPRLFPGGQKKVLPIPAGVMRHYAGADMKVYVFEGDVYFKYHRALNLVRIGSLAQVLEPGFKMPCDQVPGRSGLPWQRGL